ncbi:MAG: Signal peptide peptidase [Methanomassiliicoccales archaeon PtaU1.Bin124]|nr:MAG: Signal peptide peptidase [Methanomassiliicoccales archaeon PtaU1.Bin124]
MRTRTQYLAVFAIFFAVQMAALLLAPILYNLQFQAFQDPSSPVNPLLYVVLMVLMTGFMLLLLRYGGDWALRLLFLFAVFFTIYAIFLPLLLTFTSDENLIELVPTAVALGLTFLLYKDPQWYTIDIVGFLVGVGAAAILGVSLGIIPALLLLSILAIYDAISVYKTKHMLALAEGATKLRLPILFVIPTGRKFDMKELDDLDLKDREKDGSRGAMMMGVGDAVIPGILVVSAAVFLSESGSVLIYTVPALITAAFTLAGAFVGFALLMRAVSSGRPQAGLPFLNGGAIVGFLLGHLLAYGNLWL